LIRDFLARLIRRSKPNDDTRLLTVVPHRSMAGPIVNEHTALTVAAYWCCVRVISETLSQAVWHVYETTDKGRKLLPNHPADRLLHVAPNSEMDAAVWVELMVRHCVTWGNGYSEIERDESFRPMALWPIEPWRVTPRRAANGLFYEIQQPAGGSPVYIPAADMLHFRGLGDDLCGWSVIEYAARVMGLAIAQDTSMSSQMRNGARLSGLVYPPGGGTMPKEKYETIKQELTGQAAGSENHGKLYFVSHGLEFKSFAMPNTDAQLLESRKLSVVDVCRFMRVPPHMAYDLERATFSNISHQNLEFLIHTIGPWAIKLEQQATRKLTSQRTSSYTKMNLAGLLRADPEGRANYYKALRELGAISPNEIRRLEDMDELGPEGDIYLVPANMISLEQAGKEPEPPPAPMAAVEENDNDEAPPPTNRINGNGRTPSVRNN